jgi:hypothetical protein
LSALQFLACCIACFRLTRLITDDKITDWLRAKVVKEAPPKLKAKAREGITCPFCVSFYWACLITLGACLLGWLPAASSPLWLAAVWGGSVLINQIFAALTKQA